MTEFPFEEAEKLWRRLADFEHESPTSGTRARIANCFHEMIRRAARAEDQLSEFRRQVREDVDQMISRWPKDWDERMFMTLLGKYSSTPYDPLAEAIRDVRDGRAGLTVESHAACLRNALNDRGYEIRKKSDD